MEQVPVPKMKQSKRVRVCDCDLSTICPCVSKSCQHKEQEDEENACAVHGQRVLERLEQVDELERSFSRKLPAIQREEEEAEEQRKEREQGQEARKWEEQRLLTTSESEGGIPSTHLTSCSKEYVRPRSIDECHPSSIKAKRIKRIKRRREEPRFDPRTRPLPVPPVPAKSPIISRIAPSPPARPKTDKPVRSSSKVESNQPESGTIYTHTHTSVHKISNLSCPTHIFQIMNQSDKCSLP